MKELATRHALGAGLVRIAPQLLTESLLLTLVGGAIGLGLGMVGVRLLGRFGLDATPQGTAVVVDATVIAFTFALARGRRLPDRPDPDRRPAPHEPGQAFREEGRTGTAGRARRTVAALLVTAQVAFAFMLLIGAGLLLASFQRVLAVRPGFDANHVLTGDRQPAGGALQGGPAAHRVLEPACAIASRRCPASRRPASRAIFRSAATTATA